MRVFSWNVNGLRAVLKKGFLDWAENSGGDILALQETRCREDQIPPEIAELKDWHFAIAAAERAGYSGVANLSRKAPDWQDTSLGDDEFDREGRVLMQRHGRLLLVNTYFPNGSGKERDNSRVPYKLNFYRHLFDLLEPQRRRGEPILVLGDWNTAHRDIDLARPKENRMTSGFLPEECDELDRWLSNGWTDTFRVFEPGGGFYTWWSQRFGVRAKNIGWRIDMMLASPGVVPHLRGAAIHPDVTGSDHCPISVELDDAVAAPA
jgi:exodeoxyribonuclease III